MIDKVLSFIMPPVVIKVLMQKAPQIKKKKKKALTHFPILQRNISATETVKIQLFKKTLPFTVLK